MKKRKKRWKKEKGGERWEKREGDVIDYEVVEESIGKGGGKVEVLGEEGRKLMGRFSGEE